MLQIIITQILQFKKIEIKDHLIHLIKSQKKIKKKEIDPEVEMKKAKKKKKENIEYII